MSKVSGPDWAQWLNSPVTRLVHEHLTEIQNDGIHKMLNINAAEKTLEMIGTDYVAARYFVDGVGQFTDLDSLKDILVEADNESA